ncbi:hypothetical protein V5P93_003855 [Actinokineospora auranticolor]|uniref:hypothetical protein n=1 Tax=Actinokineospora auranticolor TaxID=155976 RepID=UPI001FEC505A|nr:hypothetical protein [Actinokineospora auranticolor]
MPHPASAAVEPRPAPAAPPPPLVPEFCYVSDTVRSLLALAERPGLLGSVNTGSPCWSRRRPSKTSPALR